MPKFNDAFWRWFGDSKVVDAKGKPLVVYHGTNALDDFSEFTPQRGADEPGFYFTSDPEYASLYASNRKKPRIIPAYLRILRPAFVVMKVSVLHKNFDQSVMEHLITKGHDGLIVGFTDYEYETGAKTISKDAEELVVFKPTQIKSAIGNDGSWDADDADIRSNPPQDDDYEVTHVPYQPNDKHQFIFKVNGVEIGEIMIGPKGSADFEVSNVLVWPKHQFQGWATEFYQYAAMFAAERDGKLFISSLRSKDAQMLHAKFKQRGLLDDDGAIIVQDAAALSDRISRRLRS